MKKLILLAGVAALAACADTATEEAVENDVAMEAVDDMAVVEDDAIEPGDYEVTWPDGNTTVTTMNEDGTWSSATPEGEAIGGTFARNEEGRMCFTTEGDEEGPRCWTDGEEAEDGSWTATDDDGVTVTVKKVEA